MNDSKDSQPCYEQRSVYAGLRGASSLDGSEAHMGGNIIEGDPYTFSPRVWDYLTQRFNIQSVLDLGSGKGYSAAYFFNKGARVIAVDGLFENVEAAVYGYSFRSFIETAAQIHKSSVVSFRIGIWRKIFGSAG